MTVFSEDPRHPLSTPSGDRLVKAGFFPPFTLRRSPPDRGSFEARIYSTSSRTPFCKPEFRIPPYRSFKTARPPHCGKFSPTTFFRLRISPPPHTQTRGNTTFQNGHALFHPFFLSTSGLLACRFFPASPLNTPSSLRITFLWFF